MFRECYYSISLDDFCLMNWKFAELSHYTLYSKVGFCYICNTANDESLAGLKIGESAKKSINFDERMF